MFTTEEMNPTFIFIDGSYFTFYRYFSLLNWWKNAHPEKTIDEPIENEEFVGKFRKLFVETIQQLPKKLKIDKGNFYKQINKNGFEYVYNRLINKQNKNKQLC